MSEELSSQSLYDFSIVGELRYSFTTDSGIRYAAYFVDMSCYGENIHNIFSFNFDSEQNTRGYSDPKVANTLAHIINKFFSYWVIFSI